MSLTPDMLERIKAGWGDVPEVRLLLNALSEMREDLMRCGSLAVSDRLDGSIGKLKADRIQNIAYHACWPETNS